MAKKICTACGTVGSAKSVVKGSFFGELLLWVVCLFLMIFFTPFILLFPLGYSLWRLVAREKVCGACGNAPLIPVDSPRGQELLKGSEQ